MKTIDARYTLFTRIPVYFDGDQVLTDPLWAKDLQRHLPYIPDLHLCCPVEPRDMAPEKAIPVEGFSKDRVIALRRDYGYGSVLKNLWPNFRAVARAVRATHIVHSGGAGWAFPPSFYILALAPFRNFIWVMVIESAFWMKPATGRVTPRQWLRHHTYRVLLRACLKRAKARVFTTDSYRQFFGIPQERSLIAPAVWVDENQIVSDSQQRARLKARPDNEIRFVFPARLVPEKGSDTILAAVTALEEMLPDKGPQIHVDLIGEGPLGEVCRQFAEAHQGQVRVRFLDPVPYGTAFLSLLQSYDALVLANRYHEQPRVVFDAFSQGLPVISSSTEGVREIVSDGSNALLYDIDDAHALAAHMLRFANDPGLQSRLSEEALQTARGRSHAAMHQNRMTFFEDTILRDLTKH